MSSRESILHAIKANQPQQLPLPDVQPFIGTEENSVDKFINILSATGGKAVRINSLADIQSVIAGDFPAITRIVTTIPELASLAEIKSKEEEVHQLANVDLAIIQAHFGVAENAAVWITENQMQERALPFIAQSLAVVIKENDIIPTMHEAYERIGDIDYGFATFIAGPSKTADIEQSLVLGAHGPKSMMVFILSA